MGTSIYCPFKYKYELVDWLITYKGFTKSAANKLTKSQCFAIWYKHVNVIGDINETDSGYK